MLISTLLMSNDPPEAVLGQPVALWGAIIAGFASLFSALWAWSSARSARRSSQEIDIRAHEVADLDRRVSNFEQAFAYFIAAVTRDEDEHSQEGNSLAIARVVGRSELLRSNLVCTPEIDALVDKVCQSSVKVMSGATAENSLGPDLRRLRAAVRSELHANAIRRAELLSNK